VSKNLFAINKMQRFEHVFSLHPSSDLKHKICKFLVDKKLIVLQYIMSNSLMCYCNYVYVLLIDSSVFLLYIKYILFMQPTLYNTFTTTL